jgi:uncharacterized protein (DUF736 family)
MEYDNKNTGAAFLRKNANPKAPKWSGPLNVDGNDYYVSIWEKTSRSGEDFLSLKVELPLPKGEGYKPKAKFSREDDSDVPF